MNRQETQILEELVHLVMKDDLVPICAWSNNLLNEENKEVPINAEQLSYIKDNYTITHGISIEQKEIIRRQYK